jgi:hypothetical protein
MTVKHRLADSRPLAHHEIQDTMWQSSPMQSIHNCPCTARDKFSWLEHHSVSLTKGRRDFPCRYCDWEVLGRDDTSDT